MLSYFLLAQQFAVNCGAKPNFFGLEPWYQYLQLADDQHGGCAVQNFTVLGSHSGFLLIGLAVIDDLIRVAGLVALGFIIYGGITYITSQGAPDATSKAKSSIVNALIGLVVAILAAGIVNQIGTTLGAT